MSKFNDYFGKTHVVLPVIHVDFFDNGLANIELAKECGADGVFIISHGLVDDMELLDFQKQYMSLTNWNRIGINCLGLSFAEMVKYGNPGGLGVWNDNAHVDEEGDNDHIARLKTEFDSKGLGLYFGGVSFKYQPPVKDLAKATKMAIPFVDVITTSGKGTGHAADVAKIQFMCEVCEGHPIGVASGITPNNVRDYMPYSNAYLVATGIGRDFTHLDRNLLLELIANVSDPTVI